MPKGKGTDWDSFPLGKVPDNVIARAAGVSSPAVCAARKVRGIPAYRPPARARPRANPDAWSLSMRSRMAEKADGPIAEARTALGLTQHEVAGVCRGCALVVSRYERAVLSPVGEHGQWKQSAVALSNALDADPRTLFPDAVTDPIHDDQTCIGEATEAFAACGATYWESREQVRELSDALATLNPSRQMVMDMRFGLYGGEPMLLQEIADLRGLSRERIRQIEAGALKALREAMTPTVDTAPDR